MAVAVLGGTGFIGAAVVERLVRRGMAPLVLARGQHAVTTPNPTHRGQRTGIVL